MIHTFLPLRTSSLNYEECDTTGLHRFLPRDAMLMLCYRKMSVCLSVRSVRPYVTRRYCVNTPF